MKVTTADVRKLLRAHYEKEAYAVLEEVSDAAGFDRSRSADMIVMGLWPSRGLLLEGIEIKASRSDWLNELKNPAKAETFARWCDRWWIVAADLSIVAQGELPATWGLMAVVGGKLKVMTPAPRLPNPEPIERGFLAAMLKRAQSIPAGVLDAMADARVGEKVSKAVSSMEWRAQRTQIELDSLKQSVRAFEQATGLNVGYPQAHEIQLFHALKQMHAIKFPNVKDVLQSLGSMESTMAQTLHAIRRVKDAYAPALEKCVGLTSIELPTPSPVSLVRAERYSGPQTPVGSGHVFRVPTSELEREKVRSSRGFFRVWEPPLIGATRTRGTKRRPSVRTASPDEFIPNYRLTLVHAQVVEHSVELIYTESHAISPSWDIIALLPEGWTPKHEHARQMPVTFNVDDRPHVLWAVPVDVSVPMESLGEFVMNGSTTSP